MTLIKCSECGKEISDKALACIYCGFPLSLMDNKSDTTLVAGKIDRARTKYLINKICIQEETRNEAFRD